MLVEGHVSIVWRFGHVLLWAMVINSTFGASDPVDLVHDQVDRVRAQGRRLEPPSDTLKSTPPVGLASATTFRWSG
jgi:hypothetical protein